MPTTSINIKACNIGSSERHNERRKELNYVRTDLTEKNESWRAFDLSLSMHLERIKQLVKEKTGRAMQKKATPIREGVIVISPDTTMSELKDFARACQERWGIHPLQIHIHRDEGHYKVDEWKPNLHAHIVFDWVDYMTGKSIKMTKGDMSEMQTLLSEKIGMERGKESDRQHLSAMEWKAREIEKDIRKVQNFEQKLKEAEIATKEPLQEVVDKNIKRTLFGGRKVNTEQIKEQLAAIQQQYQVEKTHREIEIKGKINSLQLRLSSAEVQLDQERGKTKRLTEQLQQLEGKITKMLGEGFRAFSEDCKRYRDVVFSIANRVDMWFGQILKDKQQNTYKADRAASKLLINGKTIEQHQAIQVLNRGRGLRR